MSDKGLPIRFSKPKIPEVKPEVEQVLSQPLTPVDLQYIMNRVKECLREIVENSENPEAVMADPAVSALQEDIKYCQQITTAGFPQLNFGASNPKRTQEESTLDTLGDIWDTLDENFPELKKKIDEVGATLLDLLKKKMKEPKP